MSDADDLPPPPSALQYVAAFVSAWLWRSLLPGAVLMPIASWVERWFFWQPPVNTVAASVAYYARPYLVAGVACAVVGLVLVFSTASGRAALRPFSFRQWVAGHRELHRGPAATCMEQGEQFASGEGRDRDLREAVRMFNEAATLGEPRGFARANDCRYQLGIAFETGDGVEPDPARAAIYYDKAAGRGHPGAMVRLARLHIEGRGVPSDPSKGAYLLHVAARLHDAGAARELGRAYAEGTGVFRNPLAAWLWRRRAERWAAAGG